MITKLTPLALAVLELLHERPMHPYEMTQLMRERHVDIRVKVKAGSLYHSVARLESAGFIQVVETQRDGRRPERTVYAMTDAGRDAFHERAVGLIGELAEEHPEFLSGLAMLDELDADDAIAALENRVLRLRSAVASDEVITRTLKQRALPPIYWLDWKFVADGRRHELDWVTRLLDDLRAGRITWQRTGKPELNLVRENRDSTVEDSNVKDSNEDQAS